ncbi:MAG: hypothetical protein NTW38_08245 [Candidatus Aminicenantes bacterium]|nr:hypothetical protein [Candidatus Aminicenantes bacterium]
MNKKTFGYIVLLGSVWGLAECALGIGLKACASSISGSVMTAAALFFIAAAWVSSGRKAANVALLVAVAIVFKMFDALLLGLPLRSGAVVQPAFAFVLEGAGFLVVGALFTRFLKPSLRPGIFWGGTSALIAVSAFPLVKFVTGIPACVVPGSTVPLAWAYAPLAVGLSMLTVPLGLKTAEKVRAFAARPSWQIPAAVMLCLGLITVVRAIVPV